MLSKVYSATMQGINALPITVEVNVTDGAAWRFCIVGLPDNAVKESQERVMAALRVNSFKIALKQILINLSPADVRKEGSGLDLPMAI